MAQSRVSVLGPQNVGKSRLIERFLTSDGAGDERCLAVMLEGSETVLLFTELDWLDQDTVRESECVLVVFSLTDRESLEEARTVLERLWQCGVVGSLPVILVGNKTDLVRTRQVPADGEH